MKAISLKLEDNTFKEIDEIIDAINKPRNRYINEAIIFYNKIQKRELIAEKLKIESKLVKEDNLKILKEFEDAD
ncbi:hypothetical protein EGI22_18340 [Lacihabitans sp. LS3-19]|uniref:hypothetical protein n=1 Tax=Lacihabitans sp. LS3-19 TaxID=2487335 RepID=UPI0020CD4361|nr:hypothetical protein [Lacihabitans sp. LS3-19]MCP9769869.1 hypothetical protein [Lacihabitans sp. LS3-19]